MNVNIKKNIESEFKNIYKDLNWFPKIQGILNYSTSEIN